MILRFKVVIPHVLYRGSAPSPKDVVMLRDKFDIRKIVSLDREAGERINRTCKIVGIEHIKMYIDWDKKSLLHFLQQDFHKLFLEDGPTFFHCVEGKDRSGLATALLQIKFFGFSPQQALNAAKQLGFGIGMTKKDIQLYEKIILSCKPENEETDTNSADIVSNEREYIGDNRDSYLDEVHRGTFAPYLEHTWQDPFNTVYNYTSMQADTRQNHNDNGDALRATHDFDERNVVPQVGVYNNDSGNYGLGGVVLNSGGFLYD